MFKPMIDGTKKNLMTIGEPADCLVDTIQTADSGYHSEDTCQFAEDEKLKAAISDNQFRSRDPNFEEAAKHRPVPAEKSEGEKFRYDAERDCWICPMGKELGLDRGLRKTGGFIRKRYAARVEDCAECAIRTACLRKNAKRKTISPAIEKLPAEANACSRMRDKIDTPEGRRIYSQRMGVIG